MVTQIFSFSHARSTESFNLSAMRKSFVKKLKVSILCLGSISTALSSPVFFVPLREEGVRGGARAPVPEKRLVIEPILCLKTDYTEIDHMVRIDV